jgi:hypothetical protein
MLRVITSLVALPFLLTLLLAGAMDLRRESFGSLSVGTFELGLLPVVILAALVLFLVFLPLLLLVSRFAKISLWNSIAVGFFSALLPVLASDWLLLVDERLRLHYRMERFADSYPWLAMGAIGGLLFWLLAIFRNRALGCEKQL